MNVYVAEKKYEEISALKRIPDAVKIGMNDDEDGCLLFVVGSGIGNYCFIMNGMKVEDGELEKVQEENKALKKEVERMKELLQEIHKMTA